MFGGDIKNNNNNNDWQVMFSFISLKVFTPNNLSWEVITGSYNFKKVYVNTNAIREAWDNLDPFR